jgi:hypothetical protein
MTNTTAVTEWTRTEAGFGKRETREMADHEETWAAGCDA